MDWKQLVVWGFRTVGVVVAQLLIIVLWLWPKYRPPQATEAQGRPWYSATPQPDSLPAAAVSALEGRMIWNPTLLASIIEMCQRGTLRIEAVGTKVGFLYRLSRQAPPQYDWERTICDSMPSRTTTIDALHEAIKKREDAIGDQIGDYLQHRGIFHDNPVRVRRENPYDGSEWGMLAGALMGVGSGLWAALWLDQWWANALTGAFTGLVYLLMASSIPTGVVPTTQRGAHEIGRWLGWKETMAGRAPPDARNQADSMLPYAVALNVAQPWLDVSDSAPPWFGSGSASSLQRADLDAAFHAFMHAPEWWLTGRSDDAAKAAAQHGYELELELLDLESPDTEKAEGTANSEGGGGTVYERPQTEGVTPETEARGETAADPRGSPLDYRTYRPPGQVEEPKGGRGCHGCFMWVVGLLGMGALVLVVVAVLNLVSPAVEPCPADSPGILHHGQLLVVLDLLVDECVSVVGEVASRDAGELVVEVDRGEYEQLVRVIGPAEVLEQIPLGGRVHVAGRIGEHADGGYVVHYGVDRGWWGNLRENFGKLF